MMPMPLPMPPRRVDLRAFGLVIAVVLAISAGAAATHTGGPISGLGAACLVGTLFAVAAWMRPQTWGVAYRAWATVGKLATRATRYYVLALLFAILWLVGRAGSRIQWAPVSPEGSGWIPRDAGEGPAYDSQACNTLGVEDGRSWGSLVSHWSRRTGNGWVVAALPLLLMLAALDPRGRRSLGGSTYTLY